MQCLIKLFFPELNLHGRDRSRQGRSARHPSVAGDVAGATVAGSRSQRRATAPPRRPRERLRARAYPASRRLEEPGRAASAERLGPRPPLSGRTRESGPHVWCFSRLSLAGNPAPGNVHVHTTLFSVHRPLWGRENKNVTVLNSF